MTFRKVAATDDVWDGETRSVAIGTTRVLLLNLAGVFHAYEDRCAHRGIALSEGELSDAVLTCCAHRWRYDAATGACLSTAGARLRRFPLRVEQGAILVDVG